MKFSKRVMEDVASLLFLKPVTDSWESELAYALSHWVFMLSVIRCYNCVATHYNELGSNIKIPFLFVIGIMLNLQVPILAGNTYSLLYHVHHSAKV